MDTLVHAALIGAGATLVIDAWGIARKRLLGAPAPGYGLVGRWIGWMPRGRFRHDRISATPALKGEKAIGWTAHYAIGIGLAAILLAIWGVEWARNPTLVPALVVGLGSVAAPFLVMQPGMGAGIAASRTPRPNAARLQSLVTHAVFGLGLYASARLLAFFNFN
jgi:hypothetical protein